MSRHSIEGKNPNHDVVVGWDPPLQTYFAIVLDLSKDEDDDGYEVMWVGVEYEGIQDIHVIMMEISPYIADGLDMKEIISGLLADKKNNTACYALTGGIRPQTQRRDRRWIGNSCNSK